MRYLNEARALLDDVEKSLGRIHATRDPNLSDEGQQKARNDARTLVRNGAAEKRADILRRAAAVRDHARNVANAARPRIGDDPAALIRSEQKWNQAKALLESGRALHQITQKADLDTLLAIEEFAPTYLATRSPKPSGFSGLDENDELPDISNIIVGRLLELVPADVATKLTEAREAATDYAKAEPFLDYAAQLADGTAQSGGRIAASIQSQTAA